MMTDNANRYNIFAAVFTVVLSFALAMLVYLAGVRPYGYDLMAYGILYALPLSLMAGGVYFGCASSNGRGRLPVCVITVIALLAVILDGVRFFGRPLGLAVLMSLLLALLLGAGVGAAAYWGVKSLYNMYDDDMDMPDDDIDLFDSNANHAQIDSDMNQDATEPDTIDTIHSANDSAPRRADIAAVGNAGDAFIYVGAVVLLMFMSFSFYHNNSWHTGIFQIDSGEPSRVTVAPDATEPEIIGTFETRYSGLLGSAANTRESVRIDERDRLLCELVCGIVNANRQAEIDRQTEIVDSLAALGVYIINDAIQLYNVDGEIGGVRYTDVIAAHDTITDTLLLGGGIRHVSLDLTDDCPLLPYQDWIGCVGDYDGLGIRLYDTNDAQSALVDTWLFESNDGVNGYISKAQMLSDNTRGVYHIYLDCVSARDIDGFVPVYEYSGNVVAVFAEYSGYRDFHGSASLQYFHTGGDAQRHEISVPVDDRSFEITVSSTADSCMLSAGEIEF